MPISASKMHVNDAHIVVRRQRLEFWLPGWVQHNNPESFAYCENLPCHYREPITHRGVPKRREMREDWELAEERRQWNCTHRHRQEIQHVEMGEEAEHWLVWIRVIEYRQPEKAESSWPQSGDGRSYRFNVNGYQEILYSGANR
jgi:hypothetical protein